MSWLIDNAYTLYILLGIAAAGFFAVWRYNSRAKYLAYAVGMLAAMTFLWILTVNIKTDRQQLEDAVNEMARGVEDKQLDKVFKHISDDFRYNGNTREMLYTIAQSRIKDHDVKNIRIDRFQAKIDREMKQARTEFFVSASADRLIFFRVEADFQLDGDVWKMKTIWFYLKDQEIDITVGR